MTIFQKVLILKVPKKHKNTKMKLIKLFFSLRISLIQLFLDLTFLLGLTLNSVFFKFLQLKRAEFQLNFYMSIVSRSLFLLEIELKIKNFKSNFLDTGTKFFSQNWDTFDSRLKSFYFGMSINPFRCLFVVLEFAWKTKKLKHTRIIFNGRKKRLDSNKTCI